MTNNTESEPESDISPDGTKATNSFDASSDEVFVSSRRAAIRARWAELTFGSALLVYTVLAVLAHRYAYFDWDVRLARAIQSISIPGFASFMYVLSELGSGWIPVILVGSIGAALLIKGLKLEAAIVVIGASLGAAMNSLLKVIIGRPRPPDTLVTVVRHYAHDSFPSGHVTFFVEFFGFLLFLTFVLLKKPFPRRTLIFALTVFISLIGVSRVFMGAHWPSDVAGAYLAGGAWLMLMIEIYRQGKTKEREPVVLEETAGDK
jgi:membrane-associated phospholipid phosphatase